MARNDHDARLQYQRQDSALTLAEGLEEYYAANADRILRPQDLRPESAALFRSHDLCHVIFGLDTILADEVLADTRTLFSCDVGIRRYAAYMTRDQQAQSLFREIGYLRSILAMVLAAPRICTAAIEAVRMKKRWPWVSPASYHDRTLAELRREFGIRVV